jgi:hypothetical protein
VSLCCGKEPRTFCSSWMRSIGKLILVTLSVGTVTFDD